MANRAAQELLRRLQGKKPKAPLFLILEGGGMRGVQQAAALYQLNQIGATRAFDQVWAVSAGACNGAYFLAGQSDRVGKIYKDFLARYHTYQQLTRPLLGRKRPLEMAMSDGVNEFAPLDWDLVFDNPTALRMGAVDVHSGRIHYFGKGTRKDVLINRIRASSQVPTLNGPPVRVGSRGYLDGGLADPLPLRPLDKYPDALAIVLHTWPLGQPLLFRGKWLRLMQGTVLHAFHPELVGYHRNWTSRRDKQRARSERLQREGRVLNWYPPDVLSATCTNAALLQAAWDDSLANAALMFNAQALKKL